MEPISIFLGTLLGFLLGYLFGHRDLKFENLLGSLSDFKKTLEQKFTPRQKVVILDSKDVLPDEEEDNSND